MDEDRPLSVELPAAVLNQVNKRSVGRITASGSEGPLLKDGHHRLSRS
jgi:hypothetical protein